MNYKINKVLLALVGCAVAIVLAAVIFALTFDMNSYKPRIEAAVSGATGLQVRIKGKMALSVFPFGVSAKNIHVANRGVEIVSLENLKLGAELMPLLKKQLKITGCELVKPVVTIVKNADGKYNFESVEKISDEGPPGVSFSLNKLKLSKGTLFYLDEKTGEKTEFRDLYLVITDIPAGNTAADFIKNASFTGDISSSEMLQTNFRIENLKSSVRAVRGVYNFEPLAVSSFVYFDKKAGEKTELKNINMAVKDLVIGDSSGDIAKNISFTGNLNCKEVLNKELKIDNVSSLMKVEKGVTYLTSLNMDIFGGKAEGYVTADKSVSDAKYTIKFQILALDFSEFEKFFGAKKVIGGKGDLHASMTIEEKGDRDLMSSINGTVSLRGDDLVIYTMDLDKVLSKYEKSQKFNLVDIGAFFIAGPIGTVAIMSTAALKGYRYGDLYLHTQEGQGTITHFISHWEVTDGVANATDCALSTDHNRVALKGKLDLVRERYDNVTVALLDDKGCAKFKQKISGPFDSPEIGAVSAVSSLAEPVFDLYRKAKSFVQGGKCEVFYNGAVQQPSE